MIAGLEKIDEGSIEINNKIINQLHPSKEKQQWFFNHMHCIHMNVENMSFGLKLKKKQTRN